MFKIKLVENLGTFWTNYKTVSKNELNESVYTGDMAGHFSKRELAIPLSSVKEKQMIRIIKVIVFALALACALIAGNMAINYKLDKLKTARMDLIFKDRFLEDNCSELIKFDLNNEYKDQKYMGKFDLVTDFGNNEHPFNIKETFQTMHNLCKNGGYIWSMQSLFNGNGFYNFNSCFYEHIAAFNNYSIVYSYLIFGFENSEKYISTPVDIDYIKYIDLKNANQYTINYIFKKNGEGKFKVPYQGMGYNGDKNMLFNIDYKGKQIPLEQSYMPLSTDSLSIKYLIKEIIKRFPNKIIKTIRRFIP